MAMATVVVISGACSAQGSSDASGARVPTTGRTADPLVSGLEQSPALTDLGIPDLQHETVDRRFHTGFEDPADVASFYATPQSALTHHEVTREQVHSGGAAHKAWVTGAGGPGIERDGPNHRGYPTIQLHKLTDPGAGGAQSPTLTELWVWLDVKLEAGQWFSFATFSNDRSDRWDRVVTVNLDPAGYVDVFHVPRPNEGRPALQRTDVHFPMRTWVRLTTYLDLRPGRGAIAVWQDGVLVTAARVDPDLGDRLEQAHFGLYAPPEVAAAVVYNDDLTIAEVRVSPL